MSLALTVPFVCHTGTLTVLISYRSNVLSGPVVKGILIDTIIPSDVTFPSQLVNHNNNNVIEELPH